jgi:hypothetical protein
MRNVNTVTVLVAAGLMAGAVAKASEPALPWRVQGSQGVATVSAVQQAAPDWTAVIGTGGAAAVAAGMGKSNDVAHGSSGLAPVASVRSYPNPDWTASIGRGTAAASVRPIS